MSINLRIRYNKLIFPVIFSMFFSFLYMSIPLVMVFLLFSSILIYGERRYVVKFLDDRKYAVETLFIYLVLLSLPFVSINNYSSAIYFLLTLWSILLAIVFLKNENIEIVYKSIKYLLYIMIAVTLTYLYFTYGQYAQGYHLEHMISEKVSANGITSFLNILLGGYTILSFKLKGKSTLLCSFFVLYICFEGYGRGSIIFCLMVILINVFFLMTRAGWGTKFFFILLLCIALLLSLPYVHEIFLQTKLASGFETPRTLILKEYLGRMDGFSLFFSTSYEGTIIANKYNNNPHITYIRTHHIFGLFYFLGLSYIMAKVFFYVVRHNKIISYMMLLVIFSILVRTVTEPLLFPSLFDSLFFTSLFVIMKQDYDSERMT